MSEIRHMRPRADTEGSRGGKVIGHTGSGKPIYENHDHPSHKDFTGADHKTAEGLHKRLQKTREQKDPDKGRFGGPHMAGAIHHGIEAKKAGF